MNELVTQAQTLAIATKDDADFAGRLVQSLSDFKKQTIENWKSMKQKAQDAHKEIVAKEKAELEPIEAAITTVKSRILTWKQTQDALSFEGEKTVISGVKTRKTWKARIVDKSKVPDQYWIIDEAALDAAAKAPTMRENGIAGVEFYQDETVASN